MTSTVKTLMSSYAEQVAGVLLSLIKFLELKIAGGALLVIYAFFFHPAHWMLMLALTALITFDLITGVLAARKAGEAIESRKIIKTAFKLGIYGLLVSSTHLTELAVGFPPEWLGLEQAMIGFLAATELVSIIENAGKMGYAVPKKILNQIHKYRGDDVENGTQV